MRSLWTGTISFGYENNDVAISVDAPVNIYNARESHDISFRQMAPNGLPIAQRRVDSDGNNVEWEDLRKGYEVDKDLFIHVPDDAIDSLMPEACKTITLTDFVDRIDPIWFEDTYFVSVDKKAKAGKEAPARYAEICALVGDRIAVGSFVYRQRQHTVALRQRDGVLLLSTLYYEDEVRECPAIPVATVPGKRLATFDRIGALLTGSLNMTKYNDSFTDSVRSLLDTLIASGAFIAPIAPTATAADTIDDEALERMAAVLEDKLSDLSAIKTQKDEVSV